MEIIRQAQAQMRALGSLQWQDGYPGNGRYRTRYRLRLRMGLRETGGGKEHGCTGNRRHGGCGVPGCNGCRGENNGHGGGRQNRSIRR